jgi:hypothetical protein
MPEDPGVLDGVTGHTQNFGDRTTAFVRTGQNLTDERGPLGGLPASLPPAGHWPGAPVRLYLAGGAGVATCSPRAPPAGAVT